MQITRRTLLAGACSAAAHPLMSTMTLASAPGDARLVVIILRGAMDGLDVVRPVADPLYRQYRPKLASGEEGPGLVGRFALHPKLGGLMPLWQRGQLGFVHAVSTPYRDGRSHFDGQDLLEAGTGMGAGAAHGGWLNRLVAEIPGARVETAFGVGNDELAVLSGAAPVSRWSPEVDVDLTPATEALLHHIYAPDPLFSAAAERGLALARVIDRSDMPPLANGQARDAVAAFAAERLLGETRIAAYSLSGWDTHQAQDRSLPRALDRLQRSIMSLQEGLGEVWGKTLVMAMTEFGRTVAENGTGGTDHGTGGAMVMAGGALAGAQVWGDWPGLEEAALYKRRDLMPTGDVRRYAGWAMVSLFGVARGAVEERVFPGAELGPDPRITA